MKNEWLKKQLNPNLDNPTALQVYYRGVDEAVDAIRKQNAFKLMSGTYYLIPDPPAPEKTVSQEDTCEHDWSDRHSLSGAHWQTCVKCWSERDITIPVFTTEPERSTCEKCGALYGTSRYHVCYSIPATCTYGDMSSFIVKKSSSVFKNHRLVAGMSLSNEVD